VHCTINSGFDKLAASNTTVHLQSEDKQKFIYWTLRRVICLKNCVWPSGSSVFIMCQICKLYQSDELWSSLCQTACWMANTHTIVFKSTVVEQTAYRITQRLHTMDDIYKHKHTGYHKGFLKNKHISRRVLLDKLDGRSAREVRYPAYTAVFTRPVSWAILIQSTGQLWLKDTLI